NTFTLRGKNSSGGATDKSISIIQENKNLESDYTAEYADGMVRSIISTIDSYVKQGDMTAKEASQYFFSDSGTIKAKPKTAMEALDQVMLFAPKGAYKGASFLPTQQRMKDARTTVTPGQFIAQYKKNPVKFLNERGGAESLDKTYSRITEYAEATFIEKKDRTTSDGQELTPFQLLTAYQQNPGSFLSGTGSQILSKAYSRVNQYASATKGDQGISDNFLKNPAHTKFNTYLSYVRNNEIVTELNNQSLQKNFRSSTIMEAIPKNTQSKLTDLVLNSDLTMISEEQFIAAGKAYVKVRPLGERGYGNFDRAKNSLTKAELIELDGILQKANNAAKPGNRGIPGQKYTRLTGVEQDKIENQYLAGKFQMDIQTGAQDLDKTLGDLYTDLTRIYKETVQNPREIKSGSSMLNPKKANAVYNTDINGIGVSMAAIQSPGFQKFLEFTKDVSNINFYDMKNNSVSFMGPNIDGVTNTQNKFKDGDDIYQHVKIAEYVLNNYQNSIGNKEVKTFNLGSAQIAMEDRNKGAMIIYPTLDFLKTLQATDDKGLLTQEVVNQIAANGISLISNRRNFNNSLFKGNQTTPLESMINA
ncbi:MAG: hypothetical protein WD512_19910, partial [Candidatus Paceibacterota bacterium]